MNKKIYLLYRKIAFRLQKYIQSWKIKILKSQSNIFPFFLKIYQSTINHIVNLSASAFNSKLENFQIAILC
jgi:hypothetical protein